MTPDTLDTQISTALAARLLAMADDELILGHRDSEWTGHAPILEEDIAFANIALDEIGHANIWYALYSALVGKNTDTYPDRLVYFRKAADFRNAQFVALPRGDWAFTIVRHYLFDVYEAHHLQALATSHYTPVAEAAAKLRPEELYHLRHSQAWLKRLAGGTDESQQRMQTALDTLWPYTAQLFMAADNYSLLVDDAIAPPLRDLHSAWLDEVCDTCTTAGLTIPEHAAMLLTARDQHGPHLAPLLDDMQSVARAHPDASW